LVCKRRLARSDFSADEVQGGWVSGVHTHRLAARDQQTTSGARITPVQTRRVTVREMEIGPLIPAAAGLGPRGLPAFASGGRLCTPAARSSAQRRLGATPSQIALKPGVECVKRGSAWCGLRLVVTAPSAAT
jgi:hypothetical protein